MCQSGFIWSVGLEQCVRDCAALSYSAGATSSEDCNCIPKFQWDSTSAVCQIDCTLLAYSTATTAVDQCSCESAFEWSGSDQECVINCTLLDSTTGSVAGVFDQCQCSSDFSWNSSLLECDLQCSLLPNATDPWGDPALCDCAPHTIWNSSTLECEDCDEVCSSGAIQLTVLSYSQVSCNVYEIRLALSPVLAVYAFTDFQGQIHCAHANVTTTQLAYQGAGELHMEI